MKKILKNAKIVELLKDYLIVTLGTVLVAVGVYFFKMPNNFLTGGVYGLSMILSNFITFISPATMIIIINILLLIVGFIFINGKFGIKTIYGSLLYSGLTVIFEKIWPISGTLTLEPVLELAVGIFLSAIGAAILFNKNASTGGTDIIAMILKKYTKINVGQALLITDLIITCSTFFVYDFQTGLCSLVGLIAISTLVDYFIEKFNTYKYFTIVTTKPDEIANYILTTLHRGVTKFSAEGEYTKTEKFILLTSLRKKEALDLRNFAKSIDPDCFMIISNTSEVFGRGFIAE